MLRMLGGVRWKRWNLGGNVLREKDPVFVAGFILFSLTLSCLQAAAEETARASNMDLVGYSDLQARSAYQPVIQNQSNRWIAYVGHHGGQQLNPLTGKIEPNGTSIVDVTD